MEAEKMSESLNFFSHIKVVRTYHDNHMKQDCYSLGQYFHDDKTNTHICLKYWYILVYRYILQTYYPPWVVCAFMVSNFQTDYMMITKFESLQ